MTQRHLPVTATQATAAAAPLPLLDITNVHSNAATAAATEAVSCTPQADNATAPSSDAGSVCGSEETVSENAVSTDVSPRTASEPASPRQRARECMADLGVECSWTDSDSFYMYVYKVMICPKKYSHEWSACPFAHKGERATRRDPRHLQYGAASCPEFKSGNCPRGDLCPNSHGVFEACLHPERYRTQLCNSGAKCKRSVCFFAHALGELRTPTCQAAPAPVQQDPVPVQSTGASTAGASQAQLVKQLLGQAPADQDTVAPASKASPAPAANTASDEQLLRAQLATCQMALEQLTCMLSGSHLSTQAGGGAADLIAQLQRQSASLMPQQATAFASTDPIIQRTAAPHGYFHPANVKLSTDCEGLPFSELSPRTPFDAPTDVLSPSSGLYYGDNLSSGYGRSLHLDEPYLEARLPATLIDSIW